MADYINNVGHTLYEDVPGEELLEFHYRVLNYKEKSLAEIPFTGFSSDYVYRESKRSHDDLSGTKSLLWSGIDIDIPTRKGHSQCTPDGVRDTVLAALRARANGVILSRKYSEMRLAHLKGAGEAIRTWKSV